MSVGTAVLGSDTTGPSDDELISHALAFLEASAATAPLDQRIDFLRRTKGMSDGQIAHSLDLFHARTPKHVVFLAPGAAPGHYNPLIPLIRSLVDAGISVTVFSDGRPTDGRDGEVTDASPIGRALLAAGAALRYYRNDGRLASEARLHASWWGRQFQRLPALIDDLRSLTPAATVVVYDVFMAVAPVAAHICGLPSVGMITYAGPGMMVSSESAANRAAFAPIREWLADEFGFDQNDFGMPSMSWSVQRLTRCAHIPPPHPAAWLCTRLTLTPRVQSAVCVVLQVRRVDGTQSRLYVRGALLRATYPRAAGPLWGAHICMHWVDACWRCAAGRGSAGARAAARLHGRGHVSLRRRHTSHGRCHVC